MHNVCIKKKIYAMILRHRSVALGGSIAVNPEMSFQAVICLLLKPYFQKYRHIMFFCSGQIVRYLHAMLCSPYKVHYGQKL